MKYVKEHSLDIEIDSAGTSSYHIGEYPCPNSIKVCRSHNIDISKLKSSQISKADIEHFDLIVALDEQNLKDLKAMGAKNVRKLGDFGLNSKDIPDPYFYSGYDGFEKVYEMIEFCVANLFENRSTL
jgi:protein-tyrosine phosphatase